ncbi:MAG: MGH1-like glycoside hydrolase domain-containing protein, partial [Bdellovibrionota bacterium]
MNPIQFPRIIVLSALLLTLPNLGFARKGVSSSKPQISQTEAPKPYGFMLKREADGSTTADWAEMYSKIQSDLSALNSNPKTRLPMPVKIRIYVDNKLKTEVPIGNNTYTFSLRTDEQYSVRLEAVSANGTVIERTAHNLLEKIKIRSVNPANYSGENTHVIHSPMDKKLGIDPDMPEVVQKIGRSKIVYVWKNPDDPKIASLQGEVDFQLLRDQNGEIKAYTATDKARNEKGLAPFVFKKDAAFVKVDAAFNENAFLWDDSFTCLHVTPFDPELCRQTLEFWLDVQKNHSQGLGDIPREVLKVNGTSYNLYAGVHLGKEIPNGGYNNPNILGDVVENLVDQTGLTAENRKLVERTLISMKSYAKWLDQFRTVKDRDGKLAGYWISDLGSGMDNIGRAPHGYFSATGYVDELARRIELEKSSARLNARLGNWKEMSAHEKKAGELDALLNTRYWSKEKGFYYDLVPGPGGKLVRQEDMPTVAGFWPLFSRSASAQQMKRIATDWYTEKTFGGTFPVRSLPPIMQELRPGSYHPEGGYWRGGNWAPTDIIKALGEERSGRPDLAADTINKKLAADS